ncbi:MAG TPA: CHASE3 domain-containing protein [Pilimelia sp.]|nr:CHASE3 domain-containing protein [Pilimelia sp.]
MNRRSWTLRQRVTALCAIVGVLLVVLAASAAGLAAANRGHLDDLIDRIGPLRTSAERLMAALVDQETGVRGYALTGETAELAPYVDGQRRERELTGAMIALLADYPELRAHLRSIVAGAARWRAEVGEPVIAAVRSGGPAAARPLAGDGAREQFDRIRADVASLQQELLAVRVQVVSSARTTGNGLVLLLVCAAVVVLFAGVALLLLLQRMVTRPVTHLAAEVRAVAGGEYDREIRSDGPPELARLAADVDAMRRKIAAELAEVREARGQIQWVNDQLQVQAAELTRSNRDLEQFAYVASHDLQEPLRKVASFCQLLQRRYQGQLDDRADQYIAFAVDGASRMQRLINDLLAFSRIGRLTAGFTDVDLNAVMGDVAGQLDLAREAAGGAVTWDPLPVVEGEEPLLTTLFANLVGNSIKFRRPDTPPRVHVSARQLADREWEVTVTDNGIGIEREFADKVFVIFQRLHAKDAYPGTGIGLAIVKKIVEYHGGRVWLDPDTTEGTTIRFTLPSAPVLGGPPAPTQPADGHEADAHQATAPAKETVA